MDRPILFSGPMVRAILDGRKTETRRVVVGVVEEPGPYTAAAWHEGRMPRCPYGVPDRLWVRETWAAPTDLDDRSPAAIAAACRAAGYSTPWAPLWYAADGAHLDTGSDVGWGGRGRWRPSIHMPRWASRLTLAVEAVRVERLQAITEEDARAEGVEPVDAVSPLGPYRWAFARLWDSINGDRASWASNPWVWVVRFSRVAWRHPALREARQLGAIERANDGGRAVTAIWRLR